MLEEARLSLGQQFRTGPPDPHQSTSSHQRGSKRRREQQNPFTIWWCFFISRGVASRHFRNPPCQVNLRLWYHQARVSCGSAFEGAQTASANVTLLCEDCVRSSSYSSRPHSSHMLPPTQHESKMQPQTNVPVETTPLFDVTISPALLA
jgi:hypothetical protein